MGHETGPLESISVLELVRYSKPLRSTSTVPVPVPGLGEGKGVTGHPFPEGEEVPSLSGPPSALEETVLPSVENPCRRTAHPFRRDSLERRTGVVRGGTVPHPEVSR